MNRKSIFYHFGAICGLVGKQTEAIKANPDTPLAKRAEWHISRMGDDWREVVEQTLTAEECAELIRGHLQGIKEREKLA